MLTRTLPWVISRALAVLSRRGVVARFLGSDAVYTRASRAALEKSFRVMYVSGRPSLGFAAVQLCSAVG